MSYHYRPVVLVVLDGWGLSSDKHNILRTTDLPTITKLTQYYPFVALQASGIGVGLPWGDAGNSEVGHITMGAGRIIYQNLPRISLTIRDESFYTLPAFIQAVSNVKKNNSTLHIMGLLSSGAIHSHYDHLVALLELAKRNEITNVAVHVFTDGRDSAPTSGVKMIEKLQKQMEKIGIGTIASISGRHWAMDRNNNWDRTERAYNMLTSTDETPLVNDIIEYLRTSYANGITDEFVEPAIIAHDDKPVERITDNDSVIFFNFREDRARQMTKAFVLDNFDGFIRAQHPHVTFVSMVEYEKDLPGLVVFPTQNITQTLGEVLSKNHKKQLRIAETEKYAHVTYFFNGGAEKPWEGESHILVPSPNVAHFDEIPEMSAAQITEKIAQSVQEEKYDFILVNYANADMVGHTGNEEACREAVRSIDKTLSILIPTVLEKGGALLITADHGNVESLRNYQTGGISTEHTSNPVPLWFVTPENHRTQPHDKDTIPQVAGLLSDIAPTILALFDITKPSVMHGQNLLPFLKK